jgi:hypothetical protein
MKKKKTNRFTDINFWASIVTILSIFLALYIFWVDKKENRKKIQQTYLNQMESLRFELKKNNDVILGFFEKDLDDWKAGTKIGHFRFSTSITNKLIAEGTIQNDTLLRNLDAIADNFNQVNRMLDIITLMAETSHINSQQEKELFARRIQGTSLTILDLNNQIKTYLPKVIKDLERNIKEIEDEK